MVSSKLEVSVDIMNLELFQDLLKAVAYLYEFADKETQEGVLNIMSNHGSLVLITRQKDRGKENG